MRKTLLILAVVAVVAAGAYGYYRYTKAPVAPTITTVKISRGDVVDAVGATGTLQAVTTVQVGPQVSGTISELNADFNSLVRKGQVLARLEPSLFQAQIDQGRANLVRAEADLERLRVASEDAQTKLTRARELSAKKLIAQTELESAEVALRSADAQMRSQQAAVTQSQAALKQNEVNLQHAVITSPIDGLVISRNVDNGQTVAASMSAPTLFVLAADLTKMQVLASLDESDVGRIRPGQTVRFHVDAFPNEEFVGAVTQVRLQPTTVQNVVTYQTVIDVPNPQLKLKPGMTANVNIEIARREDVLRVPNSALRFRPTADIFAALGQTPPVMGGRGGGPGGNARSGEASAPVAQSQPTVAPARGASPQAAADQPQRRSNPPAAQAAATTAQSEDGQAGGRRGGRGNFAERMATMTPEEREALRERMRARGFTPPTDAEIAAAKPAAAKPEPGQAPARGAQAGRGQTARTEEPAGVTTFDALFAPLAPTESVGQVWQNVDGKLQRVRLRLGITDGQQTELLQAMDSSVQEAAEVVTNVTTAARQTATPAGGAAFPGMGAPTRGFGGGNNAGRGAGTGRGQ